ncbi:DUF4397 domain-containing protein [Pseudoflavitalea sp. G-6-1-2]|uniref:DUF4397 domain-containing protein n=1 Tax=Pseudoflavitalea sp. G-6-1-2 TaxID=2728841 RepID=UPI00146C5593|nr:DUF4397 domain-containing protein [Pseudoflavitalea sp. G-6-1-2]NML22405.1 DUF4397 domain-containing protein [Pseudoflavitalea sp. G-6-1-2]
MNKLLVVALLLLLTACSKKEINKQHDLSKVSFHNASVELTTMLGNSGTGEMVTILWDKTEPPYRDPTSSSPDVIPAPYFNKGIGPTGSLNLWLFPNSDYNSEQPWVSYGTMRAGAHVSGLTDTGTFKLLESPVMLEPDKYHSIYFTDSAGIYSLINATDEQQTPVNAIRIRLAHMSPSNDTVMVKVGKENFAAFTAGVRYRQVTAYENVPLDATGRITVRIYGRQDESTVLVRSFFEAVPGRSYTLVFKGYTKPVTYTDKKGAVVSFNNNASLLIEKMF